MELGINGLISMAKLVREDIVKMIHKAKSGHPGGSLSSVEILTAMYFGGVLDVDPDEPNKQRRDRFILSKGHCAPVLYSVLCRKGFFDTSNLDKLRQLDSILQGHPHEELVPGLDCSSGSLGQGLSIANGLGFSLKRSGIFKRVYCLLGDGELQEGQVWEAAMTASHHNLNNVCAIVDNNHVQLDGHTSDIKNVEPIADKWRAFGWNVIDIDGHCFKSLLEAFSLAELETNKPTVIIAETVKGKGVKFMENRPEWHGAAPNVDELTEALAEIKG